MTRNVTGSSSNVTVNVTTNVTPDINDNSVTSAKIADGSVTLADCSTSLQTLINRVDTNTTYTAGSGLTLTGTSFSVDNDYVKLTGNQSIAGDKSFSSIELLGDGTADGKIKLNCSQNSHGITIASPPHSANASYDLIMPTSLGTTGQVLTTNATTGQTSWTTPASSVPKVLSNITDFNGKQVSVAASFTGNNILMDNLYTTRSASSPANTSIYGAYASTSDGLTINGNYRGWSPYEHSDPASQWCEIDMGTTENVTGLWVSARNNASNYYYHPLTLQIEYYNSTTSQWTIIQQSDGSSTWPTGLQGVQNNGSSVYQASSKGYPARDSRSPVGGEDIIFGTGVSYSTQKIRVYQKTWFGSMFLRWDIYKAQGIPTYTSKNIDVDGSLNITHTEPDTSNTPSSYSLKTAGDITTSAGVYASSSQLSSDDRIKFNEVDVTNCMETLDKLEPKFYEKIMTIPKSVSGNWMPFDEDWESVKYKYDVGYEYGFVAQCVQSIPELTKLVKGSEVDANGTQTPLSLDYNSIIPITVGALKELNDRIKILESSIQNDGNGSATAIGN